MKKICTFVKNTTDMKATSKLAKSSWIALISTALVIFKKYN